MYRLKYLVDRIRFDEALNNDVEEYVGYGDFEVDFDSWWASVSGRYEVDDPVEARARALDVWARVPDIIASRRYEMWGGTEDCVFGSPHTGIGTIRPVDGVWREHGGEEVEHEIGGSVAEFLQKVGAYSHLYYYIVDGRIISITGGRYQGIEFEEYEAVILAGGIAWFNTHHRSLTPIRALEDFEKYKKDHRYDRELRTELAGGWYVRSWITHAPAGEYHYYSVLSHRNALMSMRVASIFHRDPQHLQREMLNLHENAGELFRQVVGGGENDIAF